MAHDADDDRDEVVTEMDRQHRARVKRVEEIQGDVLGMLGRVRDALALERECFLLSNRNGPNRIDSPMSLHSVLWITPSAPRYMSSITSLPC